MLEAKDIVSGYEKIEVLHNVDISIKDGRITGIIGPNGAGKSTLLKTIMGFIKPKDGRIILDGAEITGLDPYQVLRRGVAYVAQGRSVFPHMSVEENLLVGLHICSDRGMATKAMKEVYETFPLLRERSSQRAGTLSGGEQRTLEIARSLLIDPKVIMLDEPSLGLSPKYVRQTYDVIGKIASMNRTLLIVEQNVRQLLRVADYVYVLVLGKNAFEGTPKEIEGSEELRRLYLGY